MKQTLLLMLIITIFYADRAVADEFRVITFPYPPYTYDDGRDGLAVANIRKAFERAGHRISVDYYPVARAFQKFSQDKNALFLGHIAQFKKNDNLGYIVNLNVVHKILVRDDFVDGATNLRRMALLRDDQLPSGIANKMKAQVFNVDTNEQATEMLLSGRLEFLFCLGIECDALINNTGNSLRVLKGSEEPFELHLLYHRDSPPAKQVLLLNKNGFFKTP